MSYNRLLNAAHWLQLLVFLIPFGTALAEDHSTCDSDTLQAPIAAAQNSASEQRSASSTELTWREIKTVVVLPSEYSRDPNTNLPNGMSREELIADARTSVAMANEYLKPLKLVMRVAEFQIHDDPTSDPYETAVVERDPYKMLQTGINHWNSYQTEDYDLVLVLARRYFSGKYGLAYPAVSCLTQQYAVAFATQGGGGARLEYGLAHTIAHEVGHYLGMAHDAGTYSEGTTLMASRFTIHPTGFSGTSIQEALNHSGPDRQGGRCFRELAANEYGIPNDSDWDGVDDEQEELDGSDPLDPGSYRTALVSPVHALWNSFLGMINIVELVNPSSEASQVRISLYSLSGVLQHTTEFTIDAFDQYDLILNELPGFVSNSYGLLEIAFTGALEGRTSYYRLDPFAQFYEFAFSIPLLQPSYGRTLVTFNTHQPSTNEAEVKHAVLNWLTLVNLHPETKLFRISSFDHVGNVLRSIAVSVPGYGRRDVDGGHIFAGVGQIGSHQVHPEDPAAPYMSQLTRYSGNTTADSLASAYHFAFPLVARAGIGKTVHLPISGADNEDNWIELANSVSRIVSVELQLLGDSGQSVWHETISLAPFAQRHINASALLRELGLSIGSAVINPSVRNSVVAQSMCYFRIPDSGSVSAMFGVQMIEALALDLIRSYNLFLGAENWLLLSNTTSQSTTATITLATKEVANSLSIELAANQSVRLPLHDTPELGAEPNSYGFISVRAGSAGSLAGGIVRKRKTAGRVDLAIPTELR